MTPEDKDLYVTALHLGSRPITAAIEVGVSFDAVRREMQDDPDFAAAVVMAGEHVNESIEANLLARAQSGNLDAIKYWLENRAPERWSSKRRVEVSGPGGTPIQVAQQVTGDMRAAIGAAPEMTKSLLLAATQEALAAGDD